MKKFRKPIIGLAATAFIVGSTAVTAAGTLNVTNWAEYIGEETIANFRKGIRRQSHLR